MSQQIRIAFYVSKKIQQHFNTLAVFWKEKKESTYANITHIPTNSTDEMNPFDMSIVEEYFKGVCKYLCGITTSDDGVKDCVCICGETFIHSSGKYLFTHGHWTKPLSVNPSEFKYETVPEEIRKELEIRCLESPTDEVNKDRVIHVQ